MFNVTQTFTCKRAGLKPDPYNPDRMVEDWTNPQIGTVEGYIASGASALQGDPVRERVQSDAQLVIDDPGADVKIRDLIELGDRSWRVSGFPTMDINPFTGWQPTLVANLEEQRG